jgi:hypothetical protein
LEGIVLKTKTKYEEILLHEIRSMPTPLLPQALKMLRSLKDGVLSVTRHQPDVGITNTGFCGAWQDDRSADEIIADIVAHRSGFGGRRVELK